MRSKVRGIYQGICLISVICYSFNFKNYNESITTLSTRGNVIQVEKQIREKTRIPVEDIHLVPASLILRVGEAPGVMIKEIKPHDATEQDVIWVSTNPNVAMVSEGVVTPLSEGVTLILAMSKEDRSKMGIGIVTVLA